MALYVNIFTQICITLIAVTGIYVLTGLTGMFSLGQAAFMAVGAYASGIFVVKLKMPFAPAVILAVLFAVVVGYIVGIPTVRLKRDYISLVTLGFGEAITAILNRATKLTGGASGFIGIPRKTTLSLALISAIVAIALVYWFRHSKYGRQCIAVRGDELASRAMGINVPHVKMAAFLMSVALTAYSGCLYAFYITYVDPSIFGWRQSAEWVIMVFFGGVNSLTGSVLGSVILKGLPEVLRSLERYRDIIYAVLVLLVINFKPAGILGTHELSDLFRRRPIVKKEKTDESAGN